MNAPKRAFLVKTDYMVCRSQLEPLAFIDLVRTLTAWTGLELAYVPCKALHGFKQALELLLDGARLGRMDWGGEAMRGWVVLDVSGQGCGWIDWDRAEEVLSPHCQLRRADPCVTFTDGSVSHEQVLAAYHAGGFNSAVGGRHPKCREITHPGDAFGGRTLYVGARGGDKMLRAYEKGLELLAQVRRKVAPGVDLATVEIDGIPVRDMYRIEVEYRAQGRDVLPWAVVSDPLAYWRGAYPFLAELLPGDAVAIKRPMRSRGSVAVEAMEATIRRQFGPAIFTLLHVYGGDIGAVFDKIAGNDHCERLLRAGALLDVREEPS